MEPFSYAPIQSIGHSLLRQVTLYLNHQLVYDSDTNYAYLAYIGNTLNYDKSCKETTLQLAGYAPDEKMDTDASTDYQQRCKMVVKGKSCQVAANLLIPIFQTERLMLNYSNIRLVAHPNSSSFLVECQGQENALVAPRVRLNIEDVHLMVNAYDLHDGMSNALEKHLQETQMIQYPYTNVQLRHYNIEGNRTESAAIPCFTSRIPKRVIVGLVESDAFRGSTLKSPFNFQNFNIQNVYLDVGGVTVPNRPMNLDYPEDQFATAYLSMVEGLGLARNDRNNGITMEMFKNGYNFYVFELSPTANTPMFDLVKNSNVVLRIQFREKTPSDGLVALVYAEVDSMLLMNGDRCPVMEKFT
ncbi:unnamed protein product [Caenorhabditis auriculariae]|uniref:Uncharacterized protein n=1 Tax=Caenorhabditis auriculariae TaxID=2777116 RepID=A0A8S1HP49_9PELO|nr:unnamed protein product [Caenorhabditis auriculariae]